MSEFTNIMLANAVAAKIPTDGLVFHASFRDVILAESGQGPREYSFYTRLVVDDALGRNVLETPSDPLVFDTDGLPVGDVPFSICLLAKMSYADDNSMLFGWGDTPWNETVAALRYDHQGMRLSPWGSTNTEPKIDPDYGSWHHWCGTYDGNGHAKLYLDGRLAATGNFHFDIGSEACSLGTFWAGEYIEFRAANARIYNRALFSSEVFALSMEV